MLETQMPAAQSGYISGSDLLMSLGIQCIGHCTGHTITYNTETKSRMVKAPVTVTDSSTSLWQQSSVSGLSISGTGKGYVYNKEEELSVDDLKAAWYEGKPITLKAFKRGGDTSPYLVVDVIITKVEEDEQAGEDATFSVEFQSTGKPSVFNP